MVEKDISRIAVVQRCRYATNGRERNKSENASCNQLIGIVGTPFFKGVNVTCLPSKGGGVDKLTKGLGV